MNNLCGSEERLKHVAASSDGMDVQNTYDRYTQCIVSLTLYDTIASPRLEDRVKTLLGICMIMSDVVIYVVKSNSLTKNDFAYISTEAQVLFPLLFSAFSFCRTYAHLCLDNTLR